MTRLGLCLLALYGLAACAPVHLPSGQDIGWAPPDPLVGWLTQVLTALAAVGNLLGVVVGQ